LVPKADDILQPFNCDILLPNDIMRRQKIMLLPTLVLILSPRMKKCMGILCSNTCTALYNFSLTHSLS